MKTILRLKVLDGVLWPNQDNGASVYGGWLKLGSSGNVEYKDCVTRVLEKQWGI